MTKLFTQPCDFLLGVADIASLPASRYSEVAFAGRSNVGKSSLLNALTGRKIAHASNTPGRTQQMNFFLLGQKLMLVDLPGYGYAKAPRSEAKQWMRLVSMYLTDRPNIKRVLLLVDARHGIKPGDEETMATLDLTAVPYQIVLTKADKVKPAALSALVEDIKVAIAHHPAAIPEIIATSSVNKDGIERLRAVIAAFIK